MGTRPDRRARRAADLQVDDFVHHPLAPVRVVGFQPSAPGTVRVVGRMASGTDITATHAASLLLDVTRLVDDVTVYARHLRLAATPVR